MLRYRGRTRWPRECCVTRKRRGREAVFGEESSPYIVFCRRAYHAQVHVGVRNLRFLCSRSSVEIRRRSIAAATPALTIPYPSEQRQVMSPRKRRRTSGSVNLWCPREFAANVVLYYVLRFFPLPPSPHFLISHHEILKPARLIMSETDIDYSIKCYNAGHLIIKICIESTGEYVSI